MTLHNTVTFARKALIGVLLGAALIIFLVVLFKLSIYVKNIFFPPKPQATSINFGTLPLLAFPKNITSIPLTYTINTVSGELPKFPDRLNIYPLKQPAPNLLNLNKAKAKVDSLGFKDDNNKLLPETDLENSNYAWQEISGLRKKIIFNTVTFDFSLSSSYKSSLTVLNAENLSTKEHAITTALSFLNVINQIPQDLDQEKSTTQLLAIIDGQLTPTTSLSKAQVIKVDLHQKDVAYDLNTGIPEATGGYKKIPLILPILYPNPPGSTMSFWIASGQTKAEVVAADYVHQAVDINPSIEATYPIKTAAYAFDDLKKGKGYIAAYNGSKKSVNITKVYLAYYIGKTPQKYLMPIIVFEGENGFIAYISAVSEEWTN